MFAPTATRRRKAYHRYTVLSMLLIVSFLSSSMPQPDPAAAASTAAPPVVPSTPANNPPPDHETRGDEHYPPSVIGQAAPGETTTARTAYSRTVRNADGTSTATFSVRPMHWQDAQTGAWNEFVNDLRPSTDPAYAYENSTNGYQARFGKAPDVSQGRPLLRMGSAGAAISMAAVGINPQGVSASGAQVTYASAYPGADLRYTVDNERVKEEIVLARPPANAAAATYTFDLGLEGLTATKRADGTIDFKDAGGTLIAMMPAPFMVDSNQEAGAGAISYAVDVTLEEYGQNKLRLQLTPNLQWLQDSARVYPIVVDPTIEWVTYTPVGSVAQNTTIWEENPTTNTSSSTTLSVGKNSSGARRNTLIQFPEVDTLPTDIVIVESVLDMYAASGTSGLSMEVHHNTTAWDDATVTWNTAPGMDAKIWTTRTTTVPGWNRFAVTPLVRAWLEGHLPNSGMRVLCNCSAGQATTFNSSHATSNQPGLTVTYVPVGRLGQNALWQYSNYSPGGSTNADVNVSTGNHVVTHSSGSIATRGFNVDLTHTYNSQDLYGQTDGYERTGAFYGEGWTFSQNLRLYELNNGHAVVFKDSTGGHYAYVTEQDVNGTRTYARALYYNMTLTKDTRSPVADPAKVYTLKPDSGGQVLYFDGGGKLRRIEDRNGNYLVYAYNTDATNISDINGRLTSITDVAGRRTLFEHSGPGGRLSKITDMAQRVSTYGYDTQGNLTTIKQGVGTVDEVATTFSYGPANQIQNITNPRGHTAQRSLYYRNSWEPADSGTGSTEGWTANANTTINQTTERAFHGSASLKLNVSNITNTTAGGATRTYTTPDIWNSIQQDLTIWVYVPSGAQLQGQLVVTDAQNRTQAGPLTLVNGGVWTAVRLPAARISPAYKVKQISFKVTTPAGAAAYTGAVWLDFLVVRGLTSRLYDAKPAHDLVAWHQYNWAGMQTKVAQLDTGGTPRNETYTYDRYGQVTSATDPANSTVNVSYDADHRVTSVQDTSGTSRFDYYANRNDLRSAINPVGETQRQGIDTTTGDVRYMLDERNEQRRASGQDFVALIYVRDSAGNVTSAQMNRYAAGTNLELSPFPAPLTTLRETKYTYGAGGVTTSMTDPNGNITSFTYDTGTGYLTKVDSPAGTGETSRRITTYTRTADGNTASMVDPKGQTTTYEYDGLGQARKTNYGVGTAQAFSVSVTYDQNGNRTSMTDSEGSSTATYDENNQLTSQTRMQNGVTKTASYRYFANGLQASMTTFNGEAVTYTYDAALRLASQTDPKDGGRAITYGYDAYFGRTSVTYPSGVSQRVVYDTIGRVDVLTLQKSDGTVLQRFDYDYGIDTNGNRAPNYWNGKVLSVTELDGSKVTYGYDEFGHLTSAVRTGNAPFNHTYAYDRNSNRTSVVLKSPDGTTTTTDATYDAANQVLSYGSTTYAYDRNGNQVQSGNDQSSYDPANRWRSGTSNGQSVTFGYDGAGRRVSKSVAGARTEYWYDQTGLVLETGAATATYLRDPNGSLRSTNSSGATYNYGQDQQGSITALTTTSGTLANTYAYTPYGYVSGATGTVYNPFKFTGGYHDGGAYYQMGARYYHQSTGRFTQVDPLPCTNNGGQPYTYANGDPANFVDPDGLCARPTYRATPTPYEYRGFAWADYYACRAGCALGAAGLAYLARNASAAKQIGANAGAIGGYDFCVGICNKYAGWRKMATVRYYKWCGSAFMGCHTYIPGQGPKQVRC
jgi:RHS repeat-associated protein